MCLAFLNSAAATMDTRTLCDIVAKSRVNNTRLRGRSRTGEMKALWNALQNSAELVIRDKKAGDKVMVSRPVRIAIELAMVTLQRRAEVAGMRRSELDLPRKTWLIPAERAKGRAEHLVPLSDRAVELIEAALELQETRRKIVAPGAGLQCIRTQAIKGALNTKTRLSPAVFPLAWPPAAAL